MEAVHVDVGGVGLEHRAEDVLRRSAGTSSQRAAASSRRPRGLTDCITCQSAASSASWPGAATKSAPRGETIGPSAKPAGGASRKARLARVSARTCAVP